MTRRPRAVFLSAVGGGPIERIVEAVHQYGAVDIRSLNAFSTVRWRALRGGGRTRSALARVVVFVGYPLRAVAAAWRADVVIASTNPFWLPAVLLVMRPVHRARVITLLYDLYPDSLGQLGSRWKAIVQVMHRMNRYWARSSDAIVFISEAMQDQVERRYRPLSPSCVLTTGGDLREFDELVSQPDLADWVSGRTLVSYVGNAGHVHDVRTLADALRTLLASHGDRVAVLISATGARAEELDALAATEPGVRCEGPLDDSRWRWVQVNTDISLVALGCGYESASMPSKYFSALSAGCAIAVVAPAASDLHGLTVKHGVGVAVEPGESVRLAALLAELIDSPSRLGEARERSRELARVHDVSALAVRWSDLVKSLAS